MSGDLYKEGGPLNVRKTGTDQFTMTIPIPKDGAGRIGRECPSDTCSPGYFKVKGGTGIVENHINAYCPYCRQRSAPSDFASDAQIRYGKELAISEAHQGIQDMIKSALGLNSGGTRKFGGGLFSMEMSLKPSTKPHVNRPIEEEFRRDVICCHCGLDQTVYGLAFWCADCGEDIFFTHLDSETAVTMRMLEDVERRREILGIRVAARDIENCLEDTVSIFEASMKALLRRLLRQNGTPHEETEETFKKIGNAFQNIGRASQVLLKQADVRISDAMSDEEFNELTEIFEKRHPITHNLGVIDKKYIQKAKSAVSEGKEILVSVAEVVRAIELALVLVRFVHSSMFPPPLPSAA